MRVVGLHRREIRCEHRLLSELVEFKELLLVQNDLIHA